MGTVIQFRKKSEEKTRKIKETLEEIIRINNENKKIMARKRSTTNKSLVRDLRLTSKKAETK